MDINNRKKKEKIKKQEAVRRLKELQERADAERAHMEADEILLKLIDDEEVRNAFEKVDKWYA